MKSETIRTILNASTFESFVSIDTVNAMIAIGEITNVRFGCGDNVNGIYVTFDTYKEALKAHNEDVKNGVEASTSTGEMDAEEAQKDAEDFHWICLVNADEEEADRKDGQVCMIY